MFFHSLVHCAFLFLGFCLTALRIPAFLSLHPYILVALFLRPCFRMEDFCTMRPLGNGIPRDSYAPSCISVFASLYFLLCSLVHAPARMTSGQS